LNQTYTLCLRRVSSSQVYSVVSSLPIQNLALISITSEPLKLILLTPQRKLKDHLSFKVQFPYLAVKPKPQFLSQAARLSRLI